jgi:ribulose-phosphate 3-epimerase
VSLKISPSILSADFGHLADSVSAVEDGGADLIHVDVMDGRFVPNLTIGIPIVQALKRIARVPLDVHLMIVEPEQHIEAFANAGAAMLSVHFEASPQLSDALKTIKRLGLKAGVALNPSTPPTVLAPFSDLLDYVLVMSVNPGFSGQKFIPESSAKVQAVRAILDETGSPAAIEIDGGIQAGTAAEVVEAGADILVAASAIFNSQNPTAATRRLREAALSVSPN